MTDQEIVQGLIDRDNRITEHFFQVRCRPLLTTIMHHVFSYPVDYDELVNQLYEHLMADDCARLRKFRYQSSIYQWMKVVATRLFIHNRNDVVGDQSKEPPVDGRYPEESADTIAALSDKMDVELLLRSMDNARYADAIRNLVLDDIEPERYAEKIGVTVDNLYNIKKRAMTAIARIAIRHYCYGR